MKALIVLIVMVVVVLILCQIRLPTGPTTNNWVAGDGGFVAGGAASLILHTGKVRTYNLGALSVAKIDGPFGHMVLVADPISCKYRTVNGD